MRRLLINPNQLKDANTIGYNHAIIANGEFYMAGQVPMDTDGNIVGDNITTQARKAYANVSTLLDVVDKGISDIMKVTTHIINPHDRYFKGYKSIYWETFEEPYPCHTVLGADQLAHEQYLLEIEVEVPFSEEDIAAIVPDDDEIVQVS